MKILLKIQTLLIILSIQTSLHAESHVVKMLNQGDGGVMIFEPAILKIDEGDTVTFQATDAAHSSCLLYTSPSPRD